MVVLFGLSLITFTISRIIPADPARMMLGPRASKAQVDRQREAMGLNDPYPKQYVDYAWGVLHGDFGKSTSTRRMSPATSAGTCPGHWRWGSMPSLSRPC